MTQTGVVSWSQTAASNATADSNVNWAEGMAPSQVNDSARAMMVSVAKWRDDLAGTLQTGGTSTAYTVTTNQVFSSLTVLDLQTIVLTFNVTCGAAPTLSVDGLTAKPLQIDSTTAVASGSLRKLGIYHVTYSNALGVFVVHEGHSLIEPGRISQTANSAAPSGWLLCDGSGISRTTYADLFAAISTTYGSSDGASFKVPDTRARVIAGLDAGNATSRMLGLQTGNVSGGASVLGGVGGEESHVITQAELPSYNLSPNSASVTSNQTNIVQGTPSNSVNGGGSGKFALDATPSSATITANLPTYASGGSGATHNSVQPTIILNYIIKT